MTKHSTPGPCTGIYTTHNTLVVGGDKIQISTYLHTGIQGAKNDCLVFKYDKFPFEIDYMLYTRVELTTQRWTL